MVVLERVSLCSPGWACSGPSCSVTEQCSYKCAPPCPATSSTSLRELTESEMISFHSAFFRLTWNIKWLGTGTSYALLVSRSVALRTQAQECVVRRHLWRERLRHTINGNWMGLKKGEQVCIGPISCSTNMAVSCTHPAFWMLHGWSAAGLTVLYRMPHRPRCTYTGRCGITPCLPPTPPDSSLALMARDKFYFFLESLPSQAPLVCQPCPPFSAPFHLVIGANPAINRDMQPLFYVSKCVRMRAGKRAQ